MAGCRGGHQSRVADGSFGYRDPMQCPDGSGPYGCDEKSFWAALRANVPDLSPLLGMSHDARLTSTTFATGDWVLDGLPETARRKYLDPDLSVRREALEELWDAWDASRPSSPERTRRLRRRPCSPGRRLSEATPRSS